MESPLCVIKGTWAGTWSLIESAMVHQRGCHGGSMKEFLARPLLVHAPLRVLDGRYGGPLEPHKRRHSAPWRVYGRRQVAQRRAL